MVGSRGPVCEMLKTAGKCDVVTLHVNATNTVELRVIRAIWVVIWVVWVKGCGNM